MALSGLLLRQFLPKSFRSSTDFITLDFWGY